MIVLLVILIATVLASFTDYLFMEVLTRRFYSHAPEIWRPGEGPMRITLSQAIGTLASAAMVLLCRWSQAQPLLLALLVWCAGPLPVILQNTQWMRLHPALSAFHAAGWLARLLIAAMLALCLLTPATG